MTQTFTCGDHGALVSYLYDECEPSERRAISAHVAVCSGCAEEIASLDATRELLGAWSPPDAQLGFRVVSDAPRPDVSNVLRPSRWWQQPMPAWAQAAAAAVIFATGVTLGALRGTTATTDAPTSNPGGSNVTLAPATPGAVTAGDLSALEQRLRTELSQMRNTNGPATGSAGDAQIVERVRAMIQESEQRQQRELALRTAEIVRDFDAQRQGDLTRIERAMGQMDGTTGVEVAQQRQMLNYLMRVSQRGQ
jgi:anti-sigma factor RsiW